MKNKLHLEKKVELLAPAKNIECLYSVIEAGADSLYMGYSKYNARMFGKNFSLSDFKKGIDYAHEHKAKVYLTLNTLIKETEIDDALQLARLAVDDGVDGILVQDIGMASLIKKNIPGAILHASTQMSTSNRNGVSILKKWGFTRVVLARELNCNEVVQIKKYSLESSNTPIEIEVFIHGGLCIAYSGQCFSSAFCYNSAANRGLCRMPCWENYTLVSNNVTLNDITTIRPRDLCGLDEIVQLLDAGIDCLKIQGRLRSQNYISAITDVYRTCIDEYFHNSLNTTKLELLKQRLLTVSPRGLTGGNLCNQFSQDMVIKNAEKSEKIEDVSRAIEFENKQYTSSGVGITQNSEKHISVFLHSLNQDWDYSILSKNINNVYIPLRLFEFDELKSTIQELSSLFDVYLYMPPMIYERNQSYYYTLVNKIIHEHKLSGIVLSNISDFVLIDSLNTFGLNFVAGNHLHLYNSHTCNFFKENGISKATISTELTKQESNDLVYNSSIELEKIIYGHIDLMHIKYCLYKQRNECAGCSECYDRSKHINYKLKNNTKEFEIVTNPKQTESILFSTQPLDSTKTCTACQSVRMDFLRETPSEINSIIKAYINHDLN